MAAINNIALVAHDNRKLDLVAWLKDKRELLQNCQFVSTGTTGKLITEQTGFAVERMHSGPLGGDQQIGARISEGRVDMLIFFWDPLEPMPHDPDIKALLRIATLWNIPIACNQSTADFIVASPLMTRYQRIEPDFKYYQTRKI